MSARIVNTIAEAIDDGPDPVTQVTELSQTILDALRANGFEVVELPKPDENDEFRDALAEVKRLRDVMDELTDVLYVPTDEIVDAVRRRLTPRVIETRDQLKALPVGSIVLEDGSDGFVMESYWDEIWQMPKWLYPGDDDPQTEPTLPATVLHTPEGGDL